MLSTCTDCQEPLPASADRCPHCGRPSRFPNVIEASTIDEANTLDARYQHAKADAHRRGVENQVERFERQVQNAEAVLCRPYAELSRLAFSEQEVYATFYQRVAAGLRIPDGSSWDSLRAMCDTLLFGEANKKHIRFGALALDCKGISRYGECSLTLKETMIAHRTSLLEENSVVFAKRHNISAGNDYALPKGYRAPWQTKSRLAVAKLAGEITTHTSASEFAKVLLSQGMDGWQDRFIEVHIWGPLSIRSIRHVLVERWVTRPDEAEVMAVSDRLKKLHISLRTAL